MVNQMEIPQLTMPQFRAQNRQTCPNLGIENNGKRVGIPPSHPQIPPISPYSQIRAEIQPTGMQNFSSNPGPSHSLSLSQQAFFELDSLPPLSPSPYRELHLNSSADVSMEERDGNSNFARRTSLRIGETLPPRKAHRRSNSDIPFGFKSVLQSSPLLRPAENNQGTQPAQLIKKESCWEKGVEEGIGERKPEGEVVDDIFSAYMNLDNIDAFNSSGTNENSGTKTNGGDSSDNEATSSSVNGSGKKEGLKRNAAGDMAPTGRHYRSVSMDSFMGKVSFSDDLQGQLSPTDSMDGNSNAFSLEFTGAELKKIMANEKLSEIALSDPKRAKRILANRQSAARSKERKMRYIAELEQKVQTLQTEATALSAQLTMLHRDSAGLNSQNNELKFRLQAMEQQAQLRDALNEALTSEVQRFKRATAELSNEKFQQLSISPHMFQQMHRMQHNNGGTPASIGSEQ